MVTSWTKGDLDCTGTSSLYKLSRPAHTPNISAVPSSSLLVSQPSNWATGISTMATGYTPWGPWSPLSHGAQLSNETYGKFFFERMHVFPASENIGTILATVTSHFQYLNAFRTTAQILNNSVLSGV